VKSLMLAADLAKIDFDLDRLRWPKYISRKLDGVRAFVGPDMVLRSRNDKPIPNQHCQALFGRPEYVGMDGELIVGDPTGPNVFGVTLTGTKSVAGTPDVAFHVFDCIADRVASEPWVDRSIYVSRVLLRARVNISAVEHVLVHSAKAALELEAKFLAEGYEGAMLRNPLGALKRGRCTAGEDDLWKLKRFIDGEGVVTAVEEAEENTNAAFRDELGRLKRSSDKAGKVGKGMVGTIVINDPEWGEMRLSPGTMPHSERLAHWQDGRRGRTLIGLRVHWRAFGYGLKDKPRFARYYGVRLEHAVV
jgi:DNA ligase-1